jgi:RNA polymerase sigma-70 factor (ECF subfamily)
MDKPMAQLEDLYRDTAPALLAYFRRQPALAGAADDLLQDTFLRAFRGLGRVQQSVTPRAYVFGIARHVGLDALRAQRATEELAVDAPAPPPAAEDPRLELLRTTIAALPELQREALDLKLQHELSYEEIADVLGIPVGTVRSRLHHAVAQLRATLNPSPAP